MKLTLGIIAAFASCAAAKQPGADVYLLPNRESASPTTIPSNLARLIVMQRQSSGRDLSINDIPEDADVEKVATLMNEFGKPVPSLFDEATDEPSQLLIMVEGLTEEQIKDTRGKLDVQPAFTISDAPTGNYFEWYTGIDVSIAVHKGQKKRSCELDDIINPLDERCWRGKSLIAQFDVQTVCIDTD